jgi:hypothetical protein
LTEGPLCARGLPQLTTALIATAAIKVIRGHRTSDMTDRLVFVFAGVLAANALLSYAYTKDDIMSVSGVFYGLAAYAASRFLIDRASSATDPASQRLILEDAGAKAERPGTEGAP